MKNVLAHAASWFAGAALAAILAGALLSYVGVLAPAAGFGLFSLGLLGALGALVLGLVLVPATGLRARTGGAAQAWGAAVTGLVVLGGLLLAHRGALGKPAIHDLTTSPQRPPVFLAAAAEPGNRGRDLTYPDGGPQVVAAQAKAYPQLQPIRLEAPAGTAFDRALLAARALGWRTLDDNRERLRFEATVQSALFHFTDDIAVEVESDPNGGSIVHVRSRSRLGQSDLGVNAARIERFAHELRAFS